METVVEQADGQVEVLADLDGRVADNLEADLVDAVASGAVTPEQVRSLGDARAQALLEGVAEAPVTRDLSLAIKPEPLFAREKQQKARQRKEDASWDIDR